MTEAHAIIVAAALSLVIGYLLGNRTERRASHRQILQRHLDRIARSLYQVLASTYVADKRVNLGQDWQGWHERAERAAVELKNLRDDLRYPLWGCGGALRALSRVPSWWSNFRGDEERSAHLLKRAESLRKLIDIMIRRSYLRGRPPTPLDRIQLSFATKRLTAEWRTFTVRNRGDEDEA